MYERLTKVKTGQITIEASIIVPMIILIITALIYMTLYAHDIISIRSSAYGLGVEEGEKNTKMAGLFVIKPKIIETVSKSYIKINMDMENKENTNFIKNMIYGKNQESITVQKTMDTEVLFSARALLDTIGKGDV